MNFKGLVLTVTVVLVTDAALLALVARNRTGEAEATIEMTERELRLTPGDSDNTGVVLTLVWSSAQELSVPAASRYPWFDRARLESFGFDCRLPLIDPSAERHYRTQSLLNRPGYAVLEYGGKSWQKALEQEMEQAERLRRRPDDQPPEAAEDRKQRTENLIARRSNLVVVDAGPDAAALRRRHPDRTRFIVARAMVGLVYVPGSREPDGVGPRLAGSVVGILPDMIYVPRELRTPGDILSTKPGPDEWPRSYMKHDPRYRVTLAYGKRLEPRVIRVEAGL